MHEWFFRHGSRKRLIDWLGVDAWIDSSLAGAWQVWQDRWNAFTSFFARFRLTGWKRLLNEAISEAIRLCPVHDLPLRAEEVPIVYGLIHFPEGYVHARDERFPFANEVAYGGCCIGPRQTATVFCCDACRDESRERHGRARR